jgi:hypothetical protein
LNSVFTIFAERVLPPVPRAAWYCDQLFCVELMLDERVLEGRFPLQPPPADTGAEKASTSPAAKRSITIPVQFMIVICCTGYAKTLLLVPE